MAWYAARTEGWPAKAVIAAGLLAVVLVAAVPVALVVGVILMLFGYVVAGLALFGASVLAAVTAVVIAVTGGARQLRKLTRQFDEQASQMADDQAGEREDRVVRLRQDEYYYE